MRTAPPERRIWRRSRGSSTAGSALGASAPTRWRSAPIARGAADRAAAKRGQAEYTYLLSAVVAAWLSGLLPGDDERAGRWSTDLPQPPRQAVGTRPGAAAEADSESAVLRRRRSWAGQGSRRVSRSPFYDRYVVFPTTLELRGRLRSPASRGRDQRRPGPRGRHPAPSRSSPCSSLFTGLANGTLGRLRRKIRGPGVKTGRIATVPTIRATAPITTTLPTSTAAGYRNNPRPFNAERQQMR